MKAGGGKAFSLIEVVAAISILAITLVAVFGLMATTTRLANDVVDSQVVASLGPTIRGELERLKGELGLSGLAAIVPPAGTATPVQLAGTRDGQRVLRSDGPAPPADHALNDPEIPGIAARDRFYLVEVTQQLDLPYSSGAGYLAVTARVTWPYRLPVGPPAPDATAADGDPAREVPRSQRGVTILNLALRP